jgi:hypothetical protein
MWLATDNMHHATYTMQHTADKMQPTACNIRRTVQQTGCSIQHATRSKKTKMRAARAPTASRGPARTAPGFKADLHRRLDADAHRAPERHVRELRVRAHLRGKPGRLQSVIGWKWDRPQVGPSAVSGTIGCKWDHRP